MSRLNQSMVGNKLLALLPEADFGSIAPDLEYLDLPRSMPLATKDKQIDYVYFLTSGIGSVVVASPEGHRAEAGIFGFDGYVPTSAVSGFEISAHDVGIQVEGDGFRMPYQRFRFRMDTNPNLLKVMIRSMEGFSIQLAHTALSNAVHDVNERLARWLLMCHDRIAGNEIALTHEFISMMLAVRRPSVTTSLHILEGNGFIRSERGHITIRNRQALEEFAQDAYGEPERQYKRLMTGLF